MSTLAANDRARSDGACADGDMDAAPPPATPDTPVPPYEPFPPLETATATPPPDADRMHLGRVLSAPAAETRGGNAFSMDDLEVAKALTGLREASPALSNTTTQTVTGTQSPPPTTAAAPEPLLSLLTSQHPLISNSISAYSSAKTYSTRFRQGAEFMERNLASPMASTMSTAGRIPGVETGVRWMLRRHASTASADDDDAGHKRRRINPDGMDIERDGHTRSREPSEASGEFLPAYDDNRSPMYEECAVVPATTNGTSSTAAAAAAAATIPQNWQTRLMISTSGLGVAMSDESLRSLRYCLSWLRWANTHLSRVLESLQTVLQEWDRAQQNHDDEVAAASADGSERTALQSPPLSPASRPGPHTPPRDRAIIAKHLAALRGECVRTLKSALDVVSTYAGGALPENARQLVKTHLTSLPMRFQLAASHSSEAGSAVHSRRGSVMDGVEPTAGSGDLEAQAAGPPEAVNGARRVVVLAQEGLDMMAQVSAVVDGTIVSAESWCERLGRRPKASADAQLPAPPDAATAATAPEPSEKEQLMARDARPTADSHDVAMGDAEVKTG